jgi:hypothetical protein
MKELFRLLMVSKEKITFSISSTINPMPLESTTMDVRDHAPFISSFEAAAKRLPKGVIYQISALKAKKFFGLLEQGRLVDFGQ